MRKIETASRSEREERADEMVPTEIRVAVEKENVKLRPRVLRYDVGRPLTDGVITYATNLQTSKKIKRFSPNPSVPQGVRGKA
jgi:hypothetical protein